MIIKMTAQELPPTVVYHNEWTSFESTAIGRLFKGITYGEAAKLEVDATIWIDVEQPSGKVYGYNRAEVISVKVYDDYVRLSFKGPHIEGSASISKRDSWHKVCRCTDETKLIKLIRISPLATETGTVGSISKTSQIELKRKGAVLTLKG